VLRGKTDSWNIENVASTKMECHLGGVHGGVLRDDAGRAVKIIAMISDITERKATNTKSSGKPRRKRR